MTGEALTADSPWQRRIEMQHMGASGIWSGEEAMLGLRELLTAASDRPQRVEWRGKRFIVSLEKEPSGRAIDALRRPGPLKEGEDLG